MKYYLAVDLGASSGRHIVGWEENGQIRLEEVFRFPNGMKKSADGLIWDTDEIFSFIKTGIKKAVEKFGKIESVAIDTWGVDYVLLSGEKVLYPHFAYRNDRTIASSKAVHGILPFETLYAHTGIQFQAFNTIYQLYDDKLHGRLNGATDFLMIPEYFTYLLTGVKKKEYTNASTTGLVNAKTKEFDHEILSSLGFNENLFPKLCPAGTVVGNLKDEIAKEVGGQMQVKLCASHDTASAFEAVDCPENSIVLSSGTWSLIGAKLPSPHTDEKSCKANFTNEGGVGYIRYLRNIMGMWLINQVQKKKGVDFPTIVKEAESSNYTQTFDVNDESLTAPDDMETAIKALLSPAPKTDGDLYNAIYRSLAQSYKDAVDEMEKVLGMQFESIYIVGGGAKNAYLNRLTEEITKRKVVPLPIEATAIGNIKIQRKGE